MASAIAAAPFRGGATLVINMDDWQIRYVIRKSLDSSRRDARPAASALRAARHASKAAEYSSQPPPDIANESEWRMARLQHREAMRISSCNCRNQRQRSSGAVGVGRGIIPVSGADLAEPFALLHQK